MSYRMYSLDNQKIQILLVDTLNSRSLFRDREFKSFHFEHDISFVFAWFVIGVEWSEVVRKSTGKYIGCETQESQFLGILHYRLQSEIRWNRLASFRKFWLLLHLQWCALENQQSPFCVVHALKVIQKFWALVSKQI